MGHFGQTKPAIFSYQERNLPHRRRVAAMRYKARRGNGRHRQAAFRSGLKLASV